jgi:aerobic C4-dicarboxylate transport protein
VNGLAEETVAATAGTAPTRRPWYKQIYLWVIVGIIAGILIGNFNPDLGVSLEPLGTSFVSLIRMTIAPVIFCTVVAGIASMESVKKVGRIGGKALLYFEFMTTIALILGLLVMNITKPGSGVNANASTLKVTSTVSGFIKTGEASHWYDFIFHIFPDSVVGAFSAGDILQVLFFSVVFSFALMHMGERGVPLVRGIERTGQAFFGVIRIVMYAAPVGAFGAMAFTIGKYGIDTLTSLLQLILTFYATAIFFVLVVLGVAARYAGVSIFKLVRYLKEELLIVLGTSSSESVLPQLMKKLEHLGIPRPVVGLTVPTGYSFNLDGTCLYLTLAVIYLAQATNTPLSLGQELGIIGVLLLTSKGAAGVTGSGFIVLAATLSTVGTIPVAAIMLVFGIDKFMSECRALTNMMGNSVATLVVAKWEGQLDLERARRVLNREEGIDQFAIFDEDLLPLADADTAAAPAMSGSVKV